jgi:dephospho-CoA kinase
MKNLGILGAAGSGKGIASKYLAKRYHYKIINMGDIVRALARKEHLSPTRENLEKLQAKYSNIYKQDFVIEHALKKAFESKKPVILDGIRKPIQAKLAKQKLKAKLILVDASPSIRFERMKKRRRTGFSKTLDEFKKLESRENKVFNLNRTFRMVDYKIDNSNGKACLFRQLDRLMRRLA